LISGIVAFAPLLAFASTIFLITLGFGVITVGLRSSGEFPPMDAVEMSGMATSATAPGPAEDEAKSIV
jgi:hypothetical protein